MLVNALLPTYFVVAQKHDFEDDTTSYSSLVQSRIHFTLERVYLSGTTELK